VQPSWLVDFLAGLMVLTSLYCLARLLAARVWKRSLHRDTNIAHMADAVAMAGMLVGGLRTLPDAAWEVIFGFFTLWFAGRAGRSVTRNAIKANGGTLLSHYLSHLTMAGAMLYMFLESSPSSVARATAVMSAMGGGGRSNLTGLTLLFVLLLFGSAVWHADSLTMYTTSRRLLAAGAPVSGAAPSQFSGQFAGQLAGGLTAGRSSDAVLTDGTTTTPPLRLAPRLETACHIALCVTMGYMLIILL
jgi:hypothetical protein